jgi:hypothetical protein
MIIENKTYPKTKLKRKEYIWSLAFHHFFLRLRGLFIRRKQILEALEFLVKSEISLLV